MTHETLIVIWFCLIAVLWIGFFFLEGFDFGVALLYPAIGKNPTERRVMINSIGPTWDGNEVWLLTAGGAMFAGFPGWYSTLFSGLYLPLLLVLLGLIVRGVSFEYRALIPDDNWRDSFDWAATIGSGLVTLVFGVGFANMWRGLPVAGEPPLMTQGFWSLFSPFALLGGALLLALFVVHGAMFLTLKTAGSVRDKAHGVVRRAGPVALILLACYLVAGNICYPAADNAHLGPAAAIAMWLTGLLSVAALGGAVLAQSRRSSQRREGLAFLGTGVAIAALFATHFIKMFGTLGFSAPQVKFDMYTAASSPRTLSLMTTTVLVGFPFVLAYTLWSYWVFRKRLSVANMPPEPNALATEAAVAES